MKKTYLDENIFIIENFIEKDDLIYIQKILENMNNFTIEDVSDAHSILWKKKHEPNTVEGWDLIWHKYIDILCNLFKNDNEYFRNTGLVHLVRYKPLSFESDWAMLPHNDNDEGYVDHDGIQAIVNKGIVIYLTDNYEGGELFYINKDIKFKPKAGTLICHPGSLEYSHGVLPFKGKDRVVFSGFVYSAESKNPN